MAELIHYQPLPGITYNVRCFNGNFHRRATTNIEAVTCPLCKDEKYAIEVWEEIKNRNKKK